MTKYMTSVVVPEFGDPEVYQRREVSLPQPGSGQVLVKLSVSGVNFLDVAQRKGGTPVKAPFAAGVEGVGVVVETGDADSGLAEGQRVGWLAGGQGAFSEFALVSADKIVEIPDAIEDAVAASVLMQGITAHYLTNTTYPVADGDIVLVHAAAGGVGQLLTQMAKLKGATVIGTVSNAEKAEVAKRAGADFVFGYADFETRTRGVTEGLGAHVVFDGVGATTFKQSLQALRTRGTLVVTGNASGPIPPIDINELNAGGSLYLTRPTVMHHIGTSEELNRRASEVFALIESGRITTQIGGRYPVADLADAFRALESRGTTGKIILQH